MILEIHSPVTHSVSVSLDSSDSLDSLDSDRSRILWLMLLTLATELVHLIALSGYLTFSEVEALSQTCSRMKSILVDDAYGRDIHHALLGVVTNVKARRWRAARYAVRRGWRGWEDGEDGEDEDGEEGESLWCKVVFPGRAITWCIEDENDVTGWENVLLEALSLPSANVYLGVYQPTRMQHFYRTSLLHIAATVGSRRVVDWVVEAGGELELENNLGDTALVTAAQMGHLSVVDRLVEVGANVGATTSGGGNLLFAAAKFGHTRLVEYLLERKVCDVNQGDSRGRTPVVVAIQGGYMETLRVLVEVGGADVGGMGPMKAACTSGDVEMVSFLVARVGDGSAAQRGLALACQKNYEQVARVLLEAGVNADVSAGVETPLYLACKAGSIGLVRALVEVGGADVNSTGIILHEGFMPLNVACVCQHLHIVRYLVEAGARVEDLPEGVRSVAVAVARKLGQDDVAAMLEEGSDE